VANHRHSEVQGAAQATAAVTVNGASAERQGGFIRRELTVRQLFATFAASRELFRIERIAREIVKTREGGERKRFVGSVCWCLCVGTMFC
jgi:hypothetical protein